MRVLSRIKLVKDALVSLRPSKSWTRYKLQNGKAPTDGLEWIFHRASKRTRRYLDMIWQKIDVP